MKDPVGLTVRDHGAGDEAKLKFDGKGVQCKCHGPLSQ